LNTSRLLGIVLVIAGVLGLTYGNFSYTRQAHHAVVGPVDLSVSERQTVNVPTWAGGAAIVVGILLLGVSGRRGG
jgi:multidrug transporter EmrE-like cation transporter